MFYAHFVLAKKGPLAKIWLAAHWDKKLTKAHVFETNIEKSVDGILKPKVKMALRTSGHLLLGVVRIYSRKAKYLLQDCNEAFVKIKMAFRPGMVDLPEEHREAAMNAITLPEVFHDFDTAMPELNEVDIEAQFSLNQSRAEEITMREDYGTLNLVTHDDGFGDMGFDTDNPDIMREAIGSDAGLEQSNLLFGDGSSLDLAGKGSGIGVSGMRVMTQLTAPDHDRRMEVAPHAPMDDGFGGTIGDVGDFGHAGGLFEGDLFGEVTSSGTGAGATPGTSSQAQSLQAEIEAAVVGGEAQAAADAPDSDDDMGDHYDAGDSPHHSWGGSPPHDMGAVERELDNAAELMPPPSVPRPPSVRPMDIDGADIPEDLPITSDDAPPETPADHDNTTLLQNDEESFALAPVDATVLKGITKTKRKRKLIVDEIKNISGEEMKNQLSNTSDIVTTLDLAPPTRRLMHWKETGGVEKLFTLPARPIPSRILFKKYQRNMMIRNENEEEHPREPDLPRRGPELEAEQPITRRSARKRKHEEVEHPVLDMEPPTPMPQEYEPSVEQSDQGPATPGYPYTPRSEADMDAPQTPGGMLSTLGPPLTPGVLGPLTPGTLLHGGLTPGGLQHGGMTPGGLHHGGMTPAGLQHGDAHDLGMTPAGLHHGGMTPVGLHHGGMTPGLGIDGGLSLAGLTPAGLQHGGLTPGDLDHGGMTPGGFDHGDMTPVGLHHGGMTPGGLQHGGMTPGPLHHSMEQLPMMPQLGAEHMTSLLERSGPGSVPTTQDLDHTVPMEPLPLHGLDTHSPYQGGMQMTNLGYDEHHPEHSPPHDYDLPPSVEQGEENEREAGETEEQFEERVLNRRAAQLFSAMRPKLTLGVQLTFMELAPPHNNRKQVAQKFYSLLVLKKHQVLSLHQEETYGPLTISKGIQFETGTL